MHLPLNQRGISQIILPLFILVAIGLTVYLAQQPTNVIPHAAETTAPAGCTKVTPGRRLVQYKNCQSASEACGDQTSLLPSQDGEQDYDPFFKFDGKEVRTYPLKESVWEFGSGWKLYGMKGPRDPNTGDRTTISTGRFDNGSKSYKETDDDPTSSDGITRDGHKIEYGSGVVVEYVYNQTGSYLKNYQGLSTDTKYDPSKSYAFVPTDPNSNVKCNGASTAGSGKTDAACTVPGDCQSGVCNNKKCAAEGNKTGNTSCTNGPECQSGSCSNGKCTGGSLANGKACNDNSECASNKCDTTTNKCVSVTASKAPSSTPKSSGGNGGTTASPSPGSSASPAPSPSASASPTASTPTSSTPGSVPVSLTKAEITGFKSSFDALYARLGTTKDTGNLKVVSTIASSELGSIVSQLNTCPDDANVGKCLDDKFRTRFDFAKTAARLSAFYAIFNGVSGICVKSDFGLNPLITATSSNNAQGRVNLCTEPTAAQKIWRIFIGGKFEPILSTDTRWPANPTCASLPQDVMTHYRNAEKLFNTQAGFTSNTLCDGETTAEGPGSSDNPTPSTSPAASSSSSDPTNQLGVIDPACQTAKSRGTLKCAQSEYCIQYGSDTTKYVCATKSLYNTGLKACDASCNTSTVGGKACMDSFNGLCTTINSI